MKLIETIKKSLWKKLSVKSHAIQKPVNYLQCQPIGNRKVFRSRHYSPFENSPFLTDRIIQKPINRHAKQTNCLASTRHEPIPKCISEQTIVIIISKFSSPKNEPALFEIYVIKLQYKQKLINVRINNMKHFLRYLAQKVSWF